MLNHRLMQLMHLHKTILNQSIIPLKQQNLPSYLLYYEHHRQLQIHEVMHFRNIVIMHSHLHLTRI